jgi:hypothetical protein
MSYCRFGDSDAYLFYSKTSGQYECCDCSLREERWALMDTPQEALDHLLEHRQAGDTIDQDGIDRLTDEVEGRREQQ